MASSPLFSIALTLCFDLVLQNECINPYCQTISLKGLGPLTWQFMCNLQCPQSFDYLC